MLIPEFQKQINDTFDSLNLSDERRSILQPILEKQIEITRPNSDDVNSVNFKMTIKDDAGKPRVDAAGKAVSISQFVTEVHKNTSDKSIPLVENKNLTEDQIKKIAAGELGIKPNKTVHNKDALSQQELLDQRPSLEDVASGKIKVDITK